MKTQIYTTNTQIIKGVDKKARLNEGNGSDVCDCEARAYIVIPLHRYYRILFRKTNAR